MKCPGYHQRKRKPRRPAWKEPKVILPDEIDRILQEIAAEESPSLRRLVKTILKPVPRIRDNPPP